MSSAKVRVTYSDGSTEDTEVDLVRFTEHSVNFCVDNHVVLCVAKEYFRSYKAIESEESSLLDDCY